MSLAKLGIIILIALAGFLGGHYVASNKAIASEALAVKAVEDQKEEVEETLATERRTWDKERADLNALAAKNLQIAHDEAAAKELAVRKAVRLTEAKYQSKLKELENERNQAHNVATDTLPRNPVLPPAAPVVLKPMVCPKPADPPPDLQHTYVAESLPSLRRLLSK